MLPLKTKYDNNLINKNYIRKRGYNQLSTEVLSKLNDLFEEKIQNIKNKDKVKQMDINFQSDFIEFQNGNGMYILNKQKPLEQIWLSSPISGPSKFFLRGNSFLSIKNEEELIKFVKKEINR